jgi:hypothetical protein
MGRTHCKHFDAAVAKVSNEPADAQLLRGSLGEKTKAHALDHSRHEIPFG